MIFITIGLLPSFFIYITDSVAINLKNFAINLIYGLSWVFIWLISRNCKGKLVYMLPFLFLTTNAINIVIVESFKNTLRLNIGEEESPKI